MRAVAITKIAEWPAEARGSLYQPRVISLPQSVALDSMSPLADLNATRLMFCQGGPGISPLPFADAERSNLSTPYRVVDPITLWKQPSSSGAFVPVTTHGQPHHDTNIVLGNVWPAHDWMMHEWLLRAYPQCFCGSTGLGDVYFDGEVFRLFATLCVGGTGFDPARISDTAYMHSIRGDAVTSREFTPFEYVSQDGRYWHLVDQNRPSGNPALHKSLLTATNSDDDIMPAERYTPIGNPLRMEHGLTVQTVALMKKSAGTFGDAHDYEYFVIGCALAPGPDKLALVRRIVGTGLFEIFTHEVEAVRRDFSKALNIGHTIAEWEPFEWRLPAWFRDPHANEKFELGGWTAQPIECLRETPAYMMKAAQRAVPNASSPPRFMSVKVQDFRGLCVAFAEKPYDWSPYEPIYAPWYTPSSSPSMGGGLPGEIFAPITTIGYRGFDSDGDGKFQFASNDPWLRRAFCPNLGERVNMATFNKRFVTPAEIKEKYPEESNPANPSGSQACFEIEVEF